MPDPAGLAEDRALLEAAVRDAAGLAADLSGRANLSWDKTPGNPVSEADLAVDAFLKDRLRGARPAYGWLSEETADAPERLTCRRLWVVDPIDGTRDFLRGRSGWAVSAALVEDGAPLLAALAAPARGLAYAAIRGGGATQDGRRIAVSGRTQFAGLAMPSEPQALAASFWPEPWDAVSVERPNAIALRLAKVASGEADALFEGRTVNEWDIAAAALILTEAGGTLTDRDGGPIAFNLGRPRIDGLVAATPALHAEVQRRLGAAIAALPPERRAALER